MCVVSVENEGEVTKSGNLFFLLYFKHRKLITEMSLSRSSKVSSTVFPHLISAATHVTVTSTWEVHGSLKLYTGLNYVLCKTEDELSILTSRGKRQKDQSGLAHHLSAQEEPSRSPIITPSCYRRGKKKPGKVQWHLHEVIWVIIGRSSTGKSSFQC